MPPGNFINLEKGAWLHVRKGETQMPPDWVHLDPPICISRQKIPIYFYKRLVQTLPASSTPWQPALESLIRTVQNSAVLF